MNTIKRKASHFSSAECNAVKFVGLILVSLVLFTGINGQSIFRREKSEDKTIDINTTIPIIVPKPVTVNNGSNITISGSKSPVNLCTVAYKREELRPETNPFASFLGILVKAAGVAAAGTNLAGLPCAAGAIPAAPADAEANQIRTQLNSLVVSLDVAYTSLNASATLHANRLSNAKKLMNCEVSCTNTDFDTEITAIETVLKAPVPSLQIADLQISTLSKVLGERYKKTPPDSAEELAFIVAVNTKLECYTGFLEGLKQTREGIVTARADLKKFVEAVAQLKIANGANPAHYTRSLPQDNNAKVTGAVTCVNFFSKQVVVEAIPFSVTYENIPIATVSAGALFSSLGKRQIAVQPIKTGTDINGVATFKNVFAETDKTDFQIIPFSFLNFYLSGTRKQNLNFSVGLGVNPTNGKTQIEYFAGPSYSFKNLFIHAGAHYGKRQELGGGFVIGETVPSGFPSGLPIDRRYVAKFALGISYKIPLP